MKQLVVIALLAAGVSGCGTKPGEAQAETTSMPVNVNSLSQPGSAPASVVTQATPGTNQVAPIQTTATSTGAVNPPHGQPGHRCDLAVGAPLNSAPAATTTTITPNPVVTTTAPVTTQAAPTITTAPGMNPAHGQPGHRCDIAVGAPLNSKPATTTTTTTTPSVTPVLNPANATPVVNTQPAVTKTKTAPGMNPPHGEPGHRCDIAVGAPLNSKPPTVNTTVATDSAKK